MDVKNTENNELDSSLNIAALLCEARENLGLTTEDIAKELNLASVIVKNIENNQFDQNIPVAFIRGYIKSYATRVGLDVEPILHQFDQLFDIESPSLKRVQIISSFGKKRKEINSSNYLFKSISILIVLLFLSFAAWEVWKRYFAIQDLTQAKNSDISLQLDFSNGESDLTPSYDSDTSDLIADQAMNDLSESNQSALVTNQSNVIENNTSENNSDLSLTDSSITDSNITDSNTRNSIVNSAESIPVEPSVTSESVIDRGASALIDASKMISLVLDFSGECWVKIVDARGVVIAEGVKIAGKHMPIEGVAPFNVILGNPSAVTMSYAGQDYDLTRYPAARRAQFILN